MAIKKFRNKAIRKKKTKDIGLNNPIVRAFYFPEQSETIYATSYEEALKKLKKSNN